MGNKNVFDILKEFGDEVTAPDFDFNKWVAEHKDLLPNNKPILRFKNTSGLNNPQYETEGASGFDVRANVPQSQGLKSGEYKLIPTGLYFDIPKGYELQVRPRSGLAAKNGVTVLNSPGTIDSDYKGELKVILINHGEEYFVINHGDRIAQCVMAPVTAKNFIELKQVDEIENNTGRSASGFGSTGVQ